MHNEHSRFPDPTDSELAILRVLWQRGPSSVREIHGELDRAQSCGYTTVLKIMQIMLNKGLLVRDETNRAHIYQAVPAETKVQQRLTDRLVKKAFGGSAQKLVMGALSARKATSEELAEIRKLLDELEGENR